MLTILACALTGYLCGSIPTAIWIARFVKGIDIRTHGSGNAGATNVARVVGVGWGVFVGVIDILKGLLPVLLLGPIAGTAGGMPTAEGGLVIGISAIVGHLFPAFAHFKGGKGVLTALGVFLALLPIEAALGATVWLGVFSLSRIVSLSSLVAVTAFSATVLIRSFVFNAAHPPSIVITSILLVFLVIITHRSNIKRLVDGTESRFRRDGR